MEIFTNESTFRGSLKYFKRKTLQLNLEGFRLGDIEEITNLGVLATYKKNNQKYHIFYLYKNLRGKGIYEKIIRSKKWRIIVSDPKYYGYFKNKKIEYIPLLGINKSAEYLIACDHYGDKTDDNGIPLVYKLDIRLYILKGLGGSYTAIKSMCLDQTLKSPLFKYGSSDVIRILNNYRTVKESLIRNEIIRPRDEDVKKMVTSNEIQEKIIEDSINSKTSRVKLNRCLSSFGFNTSIFQYYNIKIKKICKV